MGNWCCCFKTTSSTSIPLAAPTTPQLTSTPRVSQINAQHAVQILQPPPALSYLDWKDCFATKLKHNERIGCLIIGWSRHPQTTRTDDLFQAILKEYEDIGGAVLINACDDKHEGKEEQENKKEENSDKIDYYNVQNTTLQHVIRNATEKTKTLTEKKLGPVIVGPYNAFETEQFQQDLDLLFSNLGAAFNLSFVAHYRYSKDISEQLLQDADLIFLGQEIVPGIAMKCWRYLFGDDEEFRKLPKHAGEVTWLHFNSVLQEATKGNCNGFLAIDLKYRPCKFYRFTLPPSQHSPES